MKILVTGGAGFIGSHFVRRMLQRSDVESLVNLDKLTYAGHLANLKQFSSDRRYHFVRGDITSNRTVDKLMHSMDVVVNFAAETHVDRSIQDASPFLKTNVVGTHVLLESARHHKIKRFVQISTDEVYGSIAHGGARETDLLNPSSPYAASKAAADHLVLAYRRTYGLPVLITRSANNYGPYQYPEKFLALFITNALENQRLPLYSDGLNERDWLYVEDHCRAIEKVLYRGRIGEIYNIGTGKGFTNIAVARLLLKRLGKPRSLIRFVPDRPGHDRRYAMRSDKIRKELGWRPQVAFRDGLNALIVWYATHRGWWEPILHRSRKYQSYYRRQYARSGR
jgi:dTDP-glucose 4,6-dehydratase